MVTTREAGLLRLAAQRVAAPSGTAAEVVAWMGALQAQDLPAAMTAVALRTASGSRAGVEAALDAGQVVRSWPMRGTLHLVDAGDLRWMLALTTERLIARAAPRRAALGIDPPMIDRARDLARGALAGCRLTRAELLAIWDDAGLLGVPQRSYHLIWHLAQTGTLCWGPLHGGEQQLVLLDEWVPPQPPLEREEALGRWALRHLTSHGPATAADFAWWTKLLAADVRAAVALARPHLERIDVDGVEHWMGTGTAAALASHRDAAESVHLLPAFDEHLLGYGDRGAVLPAEHAHRVVPGGNGVFLPTVVAGGQVVGTWRRSRAGAVTATPFTAFEGPVAAALTQLGVVLPA